MKSYYDLIYLSPHLDDAILSCAGQIYQFVQALDPQRVSVVRGDQFLELARQYLAS